MQDDGADNFCLDLDLIHCVNQNRNQHCDLDQKQQNYLCNKITHVMDCECFVIDSRVFYREITICDLSSTMVRTFHLYDPSFPQFHELNEKQRRNVLYQSSIHNMYYRTRLCFDASQSVKEGLEEIKSILLASSKFSETIIGYKGGDFERRLCRYFGCFGVNIEFLDCPKFENLCDLFLERKGKKERETFNRFHARFRRQKCSYHCSRQEVILFSCYILKKRNVDYLSLLSKYGSCT